MRAFDAPIALLKLLPMSLGVQYAQVHNEAGGNVMKKFRVVFEKSSTGYGAYAPDLPGCVATGQTLEETRARMTKAMEMHLSAMREGGDEIPQPSHFKILEAV